MPYFVQDGGEGGIRTLDTFPYTHFPGVRLRPLGHLTVRARMLPHGEAISSPREAGNQRHGYCLLSLGRGRAAASVLRKGLMSIPPPAGVKTLDMQELRVAGDRNIMEHALHALLVKLVVIAKRQQVAE